MPMTEFEPECSGVGSKCSDDCATSNDQFVHKNRSFSTSDESQHKFS